MLTILRPLTIAGYTVYQDEANDLSATPPRAVGFYVLPKSAWFAVDGDGHPLVAATLYRRPPEEANQTERGGGILQFTVELAIPDSDLAAIHDGLAQQGGGDAPISPVPFSGGRLQVDVDGVHVLDAGAVDGTAHGRCAVMLTLGPDGAARLADSHALPIEVEYALDFAYKLPAGRSAQVTTDGAAAADLLRNAGAPSPGGQLDDDPALTLADTLIDTYASAPKVQGGDDAEQTELLRVTREELARRVRDFVAGTAAPAAGDDAALQKYSAAAGAALSFSLPAGAQLQRSYRFVSDLAAALAAVDWSRGLAVVDLKPSVLKVDVQVMADFAGLPIDSVKVTLTHHGRRDSTAEFLFRDSTTVQRFHSWLDPGDQAVYDWSARIGYKGSQVTYTLGATGVSDRALVIGLGDAGIVDVTVQLGAVDPKELLKAQVDLRYQPKASGVAAETSLILDKDHAQARWLAPIGEALAAYQYQTSWALTDGGRLTRPWQSATGKTLLLNSPFTARLAVTVNALGDFAAADGVDSIAVTLRYSDPDDGYQREKALSFTAAAPQPQSWNIPLIDAHRAQYQYRTAIVRKNGQVQTMPAQSGAWVTSGEQALVVGDLNDIKLTIDPSQLKITGGSLVQVDVACEPVPGVRVQKSFVFSDGAMTPQTWTATSGAPPGPRSYTVNISYYDEDGTARQKTAQASGNTFVVPAA